jgi:hypothetical protein
MMMLGPVLMVQALSSCSLIDEPEYDDVDSSVKASLAFTVSSSSATTTRMADDVVQEQPDGGRSYRGLGQVYMIPFAIQGDKDAIESSNHPSRLFELGGDEGSPYSYTSNKSSNYGGFYLYNAYSMVRGVNAFLVYGRASTALPLKPSGVSDKAFYGSLQFNESELINPNLETLRFKPDAMYSETTAPSEATLLANYLTHIANADGWSTTSDQTLKLLYKVFTGQENDGNVMVMAGAGVNVKEHVNALYALLSGLTFTGSEATVKTNIINCIQDYSAPTTNGPTLAFTVNGKTGKDWRLTDIKIEEDNKYYHYPAKYDLPDGAAALRWDTDHFVPQTVTTTLADINSISRFCYPPELFYYANSRIDTSNKDNFQGYQSTYNTATDWDGVLTYYENKDALVTGDTKGIAIQKPLQYAVGRLKVSLKKVSTTLKDDAGKEISLTESSFPLTGIIICNQHPVGFSFEPVAANGAESHAEDHFIYDSQVGTACHLSTTDNQSIPSTLVLQSYDEEEVLIALEFENNSGTDFRGKGGVIYPGTKFYLMGKISPKDTNVTAGEDVPESVKQRVFTRDYVTIVNTEVKSLANAYNVLPNMLGGRLELGVELVPNWIQAKTTNVILE